MHTPIEIIAYCDVLSPNSADNPAMVPVPLTSQPTQDSPRTVLVSPPPDKYETLGRKYPKFTHPPIDQLESNPELVERLIQKMYSLSFTRHRYLKFVRKPTRQWTKGDYITFPGNKQFVTYGKRRMLDERVIRNHLLGKHVFGVCFKDPFDTGVITTNFAIYDIDMTDAEVAEQVAIALHYALNAEGIPNHISFSGGKGYHIEVYFTRRVSAGAVHDFLDYIVEKYRVNDLYAHLPKEKRTDNQIESRPTRTAGQGVKMSLGLHAKSDLFCGYLHINGDHLVEVDDSYHYFLDIAFEASPEVLETTHQEKQRREQERQKQEAEGQMRQALLRKRKPERQSSNDDRESVSSAKVAYHNGVHDVWLQLDTVVPVRIARTILEQGLYPGLKRHDTAFLLMRCLLFNHSKEETLQIVLEWTHTVLYPKCEHYISTPIDEHIRDMESLIECTEAVPFKNVFISKGEMDCLVSRCIDLNQNSLNVLKLRVLLGLYQCWKRTSTLCESKELPVSDEFHASTRYITSLVGVSIATFQKWRDELDHEGTVMLLDRGKSAPKQKRDERRMARYRMNVTPTAYGDTYACHVWTLSHEHFVEFLLGYFYENKEIYQLIGGRPHYKKYQRLMSVLTNLKAEH